MKPIVRNVLTNDFYEFNGENSFTNIRTGQTGSVSDKAAQKTFRINLEATEMFNEYPMIKELIKRLDLKNNENNTNLL